uniref:carnosine N-methyltransferase n=1 Tax=Rhizophora mucronata TaxID=61149 RepID=A0A2P2ME85_RHIMU
MEPRRGYNSLTLPPLGSVLSDKQHRLPVDLERLEKHIEMSGRVEAEEEEGRRKRKLEEALEVKSLRRIISAYLNYPESSEEDVKRYERSFRKLPPAHRALLSHYPSKFQRLRRCISTNSYFIFNMLQAFEPPLDMSLDTDCCEDSHLKQSHPEQTQNGPLSCREGTGLSSESTSASGRMPYLEHEGHHREQSHVVCQSPDGTTITEITKEVHGASCHESATGNCLANLGNCEVAAECDGSNVIISDQNACSSAHDWLDPSFQLHVPLLDVDKVRCIIRNIVRDWADEGKKERDQCYKPILEELDSLFPNRSRESPPTCLVPGAGLGRLALEISSLGFVSQGNEFSYYMMICSSFILNHTQTAGEWTIYPWIHSNCNSLSDSDQLHPVSIPDIHPSSAGITEGFSMCGGDFTEVYSDPSQIGVWDAVVTCFFIDTAHNIVEYIEIISRILKVGGVWINLGPLLYHFADMYGQEDVRDLFLGVCTLTIGHINWLMY